MIKIAVPATASRRNRGAILAQIDIDRPHVPLCQIKAGEYAIVSAPVPQDGLYLLDATEWADSFDPSGIIIWGSLSYTAAVDPENLQPGEFLWNPYQKSITLKSP